MKVRDYLSDDGQALLALCSAFALADNAEAEGQNPFKLAEWNQLAKKIAASALKRPAALQGQTTRELASELAVTSDEAERIARLLNRDSRQALELESLFSRGMWVVTRADELYPTKLRGTLKHQAPTVLFGAGEIYLLCRAGVAVIGSRNIDEAGAAFAREVGRKAVSSKLAVVSGGARGTDRLAMDGALEADGIALGILADSLEATIRKPDVRQLLLEERLALITSYAPTAGFSVGAAMGRNKLIYGLAEFAVVVSSDHQTGGTWAGAVEALKANWGPVLARDGARVPRGNKELLKLGATALPADQLPGIADLAEWVQQHAPRTKAEAELFDFAMREKPS